MGVSILLAQGPGHRHHDGALHALAEELAAVLVNTGNGAGGVVGVGGTAAGAVQPRPAVPAFRVGVDIAGGEFALDFLVGDTLPDVTQLEPLLTDELMKHSLVYNQGLIGKTLKVIVNGFDRNKAYLTGYTEGKIVIRFKSNDRNLIGKIVKVEVTSATPLSIEGNLVTE